ncbi:MAG: hypothetical protein QXS72_09300 [Candidatus Caldarchaeum sp.]
MKTVDLREEADLPDRLRRHFPHADTRKFQADLAIQMHDFLANGQRTIVVEAPTGLGKRL